MNKNDGGPAFPGEWHNTGDYSATAPNGEHIPPDVARKKYMTELRDQLIFCFIILLVFALAGFAGWMTDYEDAPVKYQIRQERIERPKFIKV